MARLPRLSVPGYPHLILQRASHGQPLFETDADYTFLHGLLVEQAREHEVALHAYVLLPDRFQLLLTPAGPQGMARLMQGVGRSYVRHYNTRAGRTGTLWEGRFRSTVLQPNAWLLDAMVHLDLGPVRAGLVQEPADWTWSSHGHYIGRRSDRLVTSPAAYWELGNTPFARELAYAQRVAAGLPTAREQALVDAGLHGWALGDAAFQQALQLKTERRLMRGQPGRPKSVQTGS